MGRVRWSSAQSIIQIKKKNAAQVLRKQQLMLTFYTYCMTGVRRDVCARNFFA
jgi:hypothetical protein